MKLNMCAFFFFRGTSGGIVVLLSLLASFVTSTRLIRSRLGAIDSPDQSRHGFEQYNTSEVLEKISQVTFRWFVVTKYSCLGFSRLIQANLLTISLSLIHISEPTRPY